MQKHITTLTLSNPSLIIVIVIGHFADLLELSGADTAEWAHLHLFILIEDACLCHLWAGTEVAVADPENATAHAGVLCGLGVVLSLGFLLLSS